MLGTTAPANPRVYAIAIIVAGYAACLIVNWPGHLEFDSVRQLLEGRRGIYSNWHPAIMSWMLGTFDAIVPGGALFVLFDATLAFGALLGVLWLVKRPSWLAIPVALACVALPQLFLFQAIVWKDMLFADALVAAFVCLAHAVSRRERPRARSVWLAASVVLTGLATLSRQNGPLVLPCASLALVAATAAPSGWQRSLVYGAGFLLASAALAFGVNAALQLRASKEYAPVQQLEELQLYDVGGMLKREPQMRLPVLEKGRLALAQALRADGPRLYTPIGHDRLTDDPAMRRWIRTSASVIGRQWRELVQAHPATYVAVRWEDFRWLLFPHPKECLTFAVGVITIPADLKAAHLAVRYDARDEWLNDDYATPLLGTPVFSHPAFAIIGAICLLVFLLRRRPADLAMAGLLIAAMLFTLSFFVISVACQYRYLYALDFSAIASVLYLLADFRFREASPNANN